MSELPDPVPTAATVAARVGCPAGAIADSPVLSADGAPLLVPSGGAHRPATRRLADLLGVARRRVRRTDPAFVLTATGREAGGVAPISRPQPVRTLVARTRPGTSTSGRAPGCRTRCSGRRIRS